MSSSKAPMNRRSRITNKIESSDNDNETAKESSPYDAEKEISLLFSSHKSKRTNKRRKRSSNNDRNRNRYIPLHSTKPPANYYCVANRKGHSESSLSRPRQIIEISQKQNS